MQNKSKLYVFEIRDRRDGRHLGRVFHHDAKGAMLTFHVHERDGLWRLPTDSEAINAYVDSVTPVVK